MEHWRIDQSPAQGEQNDSAGTGSAIWNEPRDHFGIENNTISEIGLRKVEAILNGFGYELTAVPRQSRRPTLDTLQKVNFHD